MKHLSCTAIFLFLLNFYTSQCTDCLNLKERCRHAENECGKFWNITEKFCEFLGKTCQVKDPLGCNITIQYLTDKYPVFRDCTCSDDIYCTIKRLLGKQCASKNENSSPVEPSKSSNSFMLKNSIQYPGVIGANPSEKTNDCNLAKQSCKANINCFSLYENFRRNCAADGNQCFLHDVGQRCLSAWTELKSTIMGNCVCPNPTKEKCVKVQNSIFNNTCLQTAKEGQTSTNTMGNNDLVFLNTNAHNAKTNNIILEWEMSSLINLEYRSTRSCLEVTTICIGDPVCNRYLAELIKACPTKENSCNINDCQATVRSFYDGMPYNIAQLLAFCDCTQSDEDCQRTGDILHSKPCATNMDPPISCVNVINTCLDDELCSQRYETFQSKCWDHSTRCNNDGNCLFGVNQEDLTCSGDDDCKAAYIGILGTKLQMQCTCSTSLDHEEHHLCNLFYHMLHSKSCLKKVSARNIHASYSDTQEKKLTVTGSQSFEIGSVIHIIAYTSGIIFSCGIIILALLQTRACRAHQKGNHPRGNASDSLMVP